jgi:hypothetical protein
MKKQNPAFPAVVCAITALLFTACFDPVGTTQREVGANTGRVVISMAGEDVSPSPETASAARTLLPVYESLLYIYEFTASGKDPVSGSFEGGTDGSADLEAGTWDLTVKGKKDGTEVLTGSVSGMVINFGETRSVNVAMTRVPQTGNGVLSYAVSFPDTVSKGYLRVFNLSGSLVEQVNLLDGTESGNGDGTKTANGSLALTEGYYRVGFHLSYSDAVLNRTVLAHVYMALTTPVSHAFTDADFFPAEVNFAKTTLAGALADISVVTFSEGVNSIHYDLPDGLESMGPTNVSRSGGSMTVTIDGGGRTVTLANTGSLITLGNNVTLVLKNIILEGRGIESDDPMNSTALVTVSAGRKLELGINALITGNKSSSNGGGVYVASNGTLDLSGGAISGNAVSSSSDSNGGGVYVASSGTLNLDSGKISGNAASSSSEPYGGGVYVATGGTLKLSGGEISGNTVSSSNNNSTVRGGGVSNQGNFIMNGGKISDNTNFYSFMSGGNGVQNGGTFTMIDGEISGNRATPIGEYSTIAVGGGVTIQGTFTMSGGEISDNTVSPSGGEIPDYSRGGGVYTSSDGTLTKTNGVIYGSDETETGSNGKNLKNTASTGAAVYASSSKYRNTTVGASQELSTGNDTNWSD